MCSGIGDLQSPHQGDSDSLALVPLPDKGDLLGFYDDPDPSDRGQGRRWHAWASLLLALADSSDDGQQSAESCLGHQILPQGRKRRGDGASAATFAR